MTLNCNYPCLRCVGNTGGDWDWCTDCYEAPDHDWINLHNEQCLNGCPTSTYVDAATNNCVDCSDVCWECNESPTTCTSCNPDGEGWDLPYFFPTDSSCFSDCTLTSVATYIDEVADRCIACDSNCATCENSSTNCLTCASPRFLNENTCVDSCETATSN